MHFQSVIVQRPPLAREPSGAFRRSRGHQYFMGIFFSLGFLLLFSSRKVRSELWQNDFRESWSVSNTWMMERQGPMAVSVTKAGRLASSSRHVRQVRHQFFKCLNTRHVSVRERVLISLVNWQKAIFNVLEASARDKYDACFEYDQCTREVSCTLLRTQNVWSSWSLSFQKIIMPIYMHDVLKVEY